MSLCLPRSPRLSASLWSGLCYQISLIEERPFLLFLKKSFLVFSLGVNVFPSTKCCMSHSVFSRTILSILSISTFSFLFFLVFVFLTGCVRVNSSVGDGLGGFRLLLTYGCSLSNVSAVLCKISFNIPPACVVGLAQC